MKERNVIDMKITDELLDYIGILARLHISEEKKQNKKSIKL